MSLFDVAILARYRIGYITANVFAVAQVVNVPGTLLWDQHTGQLADSFLLKGFLSAVALAIIAFHVVQVRACMTNPLSHIITEIYNKALLATVALRLRSV